MFKLLPAVASVSFCVSTMAFAADTPAPTPAPAPKEVAPVAPKEEEPVTVTIFTLKDGKKMEGVSYSSIGAGDLKSYLINTLEGQRLIFLEKEVASKKEELVAVDKLPEKARKEVLKNRAIAAAAKAEAELFEKDQAEVTAAKRREIQIRTALSKLLDEMALARTVTANAEQIVKSAPVETARLDAQYDAAKTELGALSGTSYDRGFIRTSVEPRRADYLRDLMISSAEEKAKVEQGKKDAQDVIARVADAMKKLDERAAPLRKEYEAAQAEVKQAMQKAKDAAHEREKAAIKEAAAANPAPAPGAAPAEKDGVTVLILKDGTILRAKQILEDPEGRAAVKDEAGKVHYVNLQDIVKREAK